jgi:hypothetical protein
MVLVRLDKHHRGSRGVSLFCRFELAAASLSVLASVNVPDACQQYSGWPPSSPGSASPACLQRRCAAHLWTLAVQPRHGRLTDAMLVEGS